MVMRKYTDLKKIFPRLLRQMRPRAHNSHSREYFFESPFLLGEGLNKELRLYLIGTRETRALRGLK